MNRTKVKLNKCKGFSLAETLVAVLIILLVSSVVAAGMPAAKEAYFKVIESANAQVYLSTTLLELRNKLSTASGIECSDDGNSVSYMDPVVGKTKISLKNSGGKSYLAVTAYEDYGADVAYTDEAIKRTVERPLISNADKFSDTGAKKQTLSVQKGDGKLFTMNDGVLTVGPFDVISSLTGGKAVASLTGYSIRVLVPTA